MRRGSSHKRSERRYAKPTTPGLTLTREPGESIDITLPSGELVVVTQLGMGRARIHIDAPRETVRIKRTELRDKAA